MSRPLGRMWISLVAPCAVAAGCLGDVPPFAGSGGGSSGGSSEGTLTGATSTAATEAASSSSSDTGGGEAPATSSSGIGGSPAGSSSASGSSSSSGVVECGLETIPETCGEAFVGLACAGLGGPEPCADEGCPSANCTFPVAAQLLADPRDGYCSSVSESVEETCLFCDGAGPAFALATTDEVAPIAIAAFPPEMPSFAHLRARGHGSFQLEWRVSADDGGFSDLFTLTDVFQTFDLPLVTGASFELRVRPAVEGPLWMEVDCAYTTSLASGDASPP